MALAYACVYFLNAAISVVHVDQQSAMQMNRCMHLVPLYPYHAT